MGRIDAHINDLASETGGAVRVSTLYAAGISPGAIRRRLDDGTLVRWHADVVIVGALGASLPTSTTLHAAVLAGHEGAVLSHTTAVACLGAWERWDGTVHVTSGSVRSRPWPPSVRFHRCRSPRPSEAHCVVDGLPTMAAPYACAQLGTELTKFQITSVIRRLEFAEHLDPACLPDLLATLGRPRGAATVREALELYALDSAGTRSRSEDRLLGGLLCAGAPEPLVNVRGATGLRGVELDLVWPDHRLVVECDGGQHLFDHARRSDEDVDEALAELGWTCIRIASRDVWTDLDACVARIMCELERRVPGIVRSRPGLGIRRAVARPVPIRDRT